MRVPQPRVSLLLIGLVFLAGQSANAQSTWDRYQSRELHEIIDAHAEDLLDNLARPDSVIALSADDFGVVTVGGKADWMFVATGL